MGAVFFYHLSQSPLEVTLPMLLHKARAAGWSIAVRGPDDQRLDWLDEQLWLGDETAFLAHGRSGGSHDANQPILLTTQSRPANNPDCVMSIDGAEISADEVYALQRTCVIFDGNAPDAVDRARAQWKALTDAGCLAEYWAQEQGKWVKKATSAR